MPRLPRTIAAHKTDEFTVLAKVVGSRVWRIINNPYAGVSPESYAVQTLDQCWFVEYVEWINSGVIYRVVRRGNVGAYRVE